MVGYYVKETNKQMENKTPIEKLQEHLDNIEASIKDIGGGAKTPECVRVGDIQLQSTAIRCDGLLSLVLGALKDKDIQKHLGLVEKKKMVGQGGIG